MDDGRSILIVDDEEDFLALLGHMLSRTGLRILTAKSGAEALGILEKSRVDLVIVDLVMAGMSGIDLLYEIRKRGKMTKFIVVTGYGEMTTYMEVMNLGAVEYLSKPVNKDHLLQIVTRVIGLKEGSE